MYGYINKYYIKQNNFNYLTICESFSNCITNVLFSKTTYSLI